MRSLLWSAVACAVVIAPLPAASQETVIGHVITREYKVTILSTQTYAHADSVFTYDVPFGSFGAVRWDIN